MRINPLKPGLLGVAIGAAVTYYIFNTEAGEEKRKAFLKRLKKARSRFEEVKEDIKEALE